MSDPASTGGRPAQQPPPETAIDIPGRVPRREDAGEPGAAPPPGEETGSGPARDAGHEHADRPVRAAIPVLVSFSAGSFTIREFTVNLSEGGIFLATDRVCPKGTRGTMKFRISRFEEPFTLAGEVVWALEPGREGPGLRPGMGIRFVDPPEADLERLRQLVEGVVNGSGVESLRKSIRENERGIDHELRNRPAEQKLMLAVQAVGEEIGALIRDGHPSVLARLLDCPRLEVAHVQAMLRNSNLPTAVVSAIGKERQWMRNEEVRWLFCIHPKAMLAEAMDATRLLPRNRLDQIACNLSVRQPIRHRATELCRRQGAPRP